MQTLRTRRRSSSHATPRVLTVTEAAELLRIGRSTAYEAANRYLAGHPDGLPVVRIGRSLRVPMKLLAEIIDTDDPLVSTGWSCNLSTTRLQPIQSSSTTTSTSLDDSPVSTEQFPVHSNSASLVAPLFQELLLHWSSGYPRPDQKIA